METSKDKEERVSRGGWIAMIAIVVSLIVVATYANWQNAHSNQIESTTVTRIAPEASASPTP
jgi:hypothetical protein